MYALKTVLKNEWKIADAIYYDEFEYKGEKVYKDITPSPYYIDGRPALYIIYRTFDDTKDLNTSRPKL